PADAGAGGELLFHDRRGVYAATRPRAGHRVAQPVGQIVELVLDVLVIVLAQRVARNAGGRLHVRRRRIEPDVVVHRDADDRLRAGQVDGRVGAFVHAPLEVLHLPRRPAFEPVLKILSITRRFGRGDAAQ